MKLAPYSDIVCAMADFRLQDASESDYDLLAGMSRASLVESGQVGTRSPGFFRSRLEELVAAGYEAVVVYRTDLAEHRPAGFALYRINPRFVHLRTLYIQDPRGERRAYRRVFELLLQARWGSLAHVRVDVPVRPRSERVTDAFFWQSLGFRGYSLRLELDTATKSKVRKSCGIVVVHRRLLHRRYLIVHHVSGGHWGFPKGHGVDGETEMDTARREVAEETAVTPEIVPGFYERTFYVTPRGRKKEVVYFLGRAASPDVTLQEEEIDDYRWARFDEAMDLLTYRNSQAVLARARTFMKGGPGSLGRDRPPDSSPYSSIDSQ